MTKRFGRALPLLVLVVACSGPAADLDGGGTDAATADSSSPPDSPSPADATLAGDAATLGALRTSRVFANSYTAGSIATSSFVAALSDRDPSSFTSTTEHVGDCDVTVTTLVAGGGIPTFAEAGTVSLTGGTMRVDLAFGTGGYPPFSSSDAALWVGGETLTFSGSGGADVPAFAAMVTAPSQLEITTPTIPPGPSRLSIDRAADLAIAWTGSSAGVVVVDLRGPEIDAMPLVSVRCELAVAAASASVPSAALMRMPAGVGTMVIVVDAATEVSVTDWGTIAIVAESPTLSGVQSFLTTTDLH